MFNQDWNRMIMISIVLGIILMAMLNIFGMGINKMSNKIGGQAVVDLVSKNSKISGYVIFSENLKEKMTLVRVNVKGLSKDDKFKWEIDGGDIKRILKSGVEKLDGLLVEEIMGRTFSIINSSGKIMASGVIGYLNTEHA